MADPTTPDPGTAGSDAAGSVNSTPGGVSDPKSARASSSRTRGALAAISGLGGAGKTALFALGLAVMFGAAYLIGWVASPDTTEDSHPTDAHSTGNHAGNAGDTRPGGLLVSDQGYTLRVLPGESNAGSLELRIIGPNGATVTKFDTKHDKRLHLIAVRRDLSGYRHVHPEMSADGTWRVASPFGGGGSYRVFADFAVTDGPALTLGTDVHVPGAFTPTPLPPPSGTATTHGYTVTMTGALQAGKASTLGFTVEKDGSPVADLQPYLAAYGHLVALREGDLAYLHVHPDGAEPTAGKPGGPRVEFTTTAPTPGTYRLFLEFQHSGTVHTVEFSVAVGTPAAPSDSGGNPASAPAHGSGHTH